MGDSTIQTQAKILYDYFTERIETDYPCLLHYALQLESAGREWHGRKGDPADFVHSAYLVFAGFPEMKGSLPLASGETLYHQLILAIRRAVWHWYEFKHVTLPGGEKSIESRGVPLPEEELEGEGQKVFIQSSTGLSLEELVHRMNDSEAATLINEAKKFGYGKNRDLAEGLGWKLPYVLKVKRRISGWTLKLKEDAAAGRMRQEWETDAHIERRLPRDRDSHLARMGLLQRLGLINKSTPFPPRVEKPFIENVDTYHARLRKAAKKEAGPGGASARGQIDTLSLRDLEMLLLALREDAF